MVVGRESGWSLLVALILMLRKSDGRCSFFMSQVLERVERSVVEADEEPLQFRNTPTPYIRYPAGASRRPHALSDPFPPIISIIIIHHRLPHSHRYGTGCHTRPPSGTPRRKPHKVAAERPADGDLIKTIIPEGASEQCRRVRAHPIRRPGSLSFGKCSRGRGRAMGT